MKEKEFSGIDLNGMKVNYKIVAKFDLNGRKYIFYTDEINMFVGYYETKKIKNITNIEEYNMLMSIYNQIKIENLNREFFDYGYTFHNGKNYKMIYDKNERKRYFFELINDRYKEVEGDVKDYFNQKFNIEILTLNFKNLSDDTKIFDNDQFERIIKITKNGMVIPVIIYGKYSLTKLQLSPSNLQNEIDINIFNNVDKIEEIELYIKNNKNLTKEEKAYFITLDNIYNDNIYYFNKLGLKENLENFNINYIEEINENKKGSYNIKTKEMKLYNTSRLDNIDIILHEYMHILSNQGLATNFLDALALSEGLTEVLAIEYGITKEGKILGTYNKQQVYIKMLAEIIPPEILTESYFKGDINLLINELNKYISEKEVYKLISNINDELIYENELGAEAYKKEVTEKNKNLKDVQKQIDLIFSQAYQNKYAISLDDDRLMCAYMDQIRKGNRAEYDYYKEGNTFYNDVTKYYFNKKLKSSVACVEYYYSPGIAIKANKEDFKLLPNGKYEYITDNGEIQIYNQIQDYVLRTKLQDYILDNNRYKNTNYTRNGEFYGK